MRKVADESGNGSKAKASDYAFRIKGADIEVQQQQSAKGLLVGTWDTSHIINDMAKFNSFDDVFKLETHCVLASQCKGIAQQRGDTEVFLIDDTGQRRKATLKDALFIPLTYTTNSSVQGPPGNDCFS